MVKKRFCRKFSFEALCGMIFLDDQRYIMRKQDDGDQFERGAFPVGSKNSCGLVRIPRQRCHSFHTKAAIDARTSLPPIPDESGR